MPAVDSAKQGWRSWYETRVRENVAGEVKLANYLVKNLFSFCERLKVARRDSEGAARK